MRSSFLVLMFAATSAAADTEIHRCLLDDGTIAFQEMPCAERVVDANPGSESDDNRSAAEETGADDDVSDFVNPFDQPASPPAAPQTTVPETVSEDRADCEKTTRDAIDAVDLEMRETAYTTEQRQEYLAKLLELTRQLRRCKAL